MTMDSSLVRDLAPDDREMLDFGSDNHFATVAIRALLAAPFSGMARTRALIAGPSGASVRPSIASRLLFGVKRRRNCSEQSVWLLSVIIQQLACGASDECIPSSQPAGCRNCNAIDQVLSQQTGEDQDDR